jgi:hypothetical protein
MAIKDFNIGLLRQTGDFQINTPISNDSGGQGDSYSTVCTTRLYLYKERGGTNLLTGQIVYSKTYTIICRFQQAIINNINVDTQWLINGEVYMVSDWEEVNEIPHLLIFKALKDE